MKHTPGPWFAGDSLTVWTKNDMSCVAKVAGPTDSDPESAANAHLIAAAPELLEALQSVEQIYAAWESDERASWAQLSLLLKDAMPQIRVAITKATTLLS